MTPLVLFASVVFATRSDFCLAGARAHTFLAQVRTMLSSPDSIPASTRREYDIKAVARAHVHLVTDEHVCVTASVAYAKHAGQAAEKHPPFTVAVVAADDLYVVELGQTAGRDVRYWEVVIFDRRWKRRASYGGGA